MLFIKGTASCLPVCPIEEARFMSMHTFIEKERRQFHVHAAINYTASLLKPRGCLQHGWPGGGGASIVTDLPLPRFLTIVDGEISC